MASWQETYEQLKKRKKQIDAGQSTSNTKPKINTLPNTNFNSKPTLLPDDFFLPTMQSKNLNASRGLPKMEKEKENKKWYEGWFKTGAFDDGYDFGDITKTILGTSKNITQNVYEGAIGIGEKTIDAGAYGIGALGGLFGNDDLQQDMQKFIEKDLIDEEKLAKYASWTNPTALVNQLVVGNKSDEYSVLDDKSQSLVQSAGQLGGTFALQSVGVPWWLTTGTTSFGGEVEQAFKKDATYGEAGFSGLVSAGAEVLTEKISGGISFGGKTLDQGLTKTISEKISNKALQKLAKFGIDATGEGLEEVATEFISTVGQQLSYEREETWNELLNNEEAMDKYLDQVGESLFGEEAKSNYAEAFIGGAVLGGGSNLGRSVTSNGDTTTDIQERNKKQQDIAPTNETIQNQQPVNTQETVEDIDSQIAVLEEQLMATENDAEYERLSKQISELEERANQLEKQGIAPVQVQQPTTQEVETNLPTDVVSNTQNIETNNSSIVETGNSIYNKSNKEVVLDGKGIELGGIRTTDTENQVRENTENREYTTREWEEFERRATETRKTELSEYEQQLNSTVENNFNKKVVFFNDKNSKYLGGASTTNGDLIYVAGDENVTDRTKNFITHHEILESDILHNKNLKSKYIDVAVEEIMNDEGFQKTKESFLDGQEDPTKVSDRLVAKDIIADIFAEQQTGINKGYDLNLSDTTLEVIDYNLERFNNEVSKNRNTEVKTHEQDIAPIRQELAEMTQELVKTVKDTTKEVTKLKKELIETKNDIKELAEESKALTEADLPYIEQLSKEALNQDVAPVRNNLTTEESQELDTLEDLPFNLTAEEQARMEELQNEERVTPEEEAITEAIDPFEDRDYEGVGNRKQKAYQYEHPEVKPYFQEMANAMLGDLNNSQKGERYVIGDISQIGGGNFEFSGQKRHTTPDIAALLDSQYNYSYDDIRKGLNAIIEDHGAENIAVAKRIEFALNDRLLHGYTDISGFEIPPNQDYINLLKENQWNDYFDSLENNDIAPYEATSEEVSKPQEAKIKTDDDFVPNYDALLDYMDNLERRRQEKKNKTAPQVELEDTTPMREATKWEQAKTTFKTLFTNNKAVYDEIAKETGNQQIKYKADRLNTVSGETADITTAQLDNDFNPVGKSLNAIFENAENQGLGEISQDFLFHLSNINRHKRNKGSADYTAIDSQIFVDTFTKKYPELAKQLQTDIRNWNKNRRNNLVDAGIISDKTSQLFEELDADYVPFFEDRGYTPTYQDVGEIGTKNVVKRAKGGAKNVLPVKQSMIKQNMAERKAIAQNDLYKEIMKSYGKKAELGADVRLKAIDFSDSLYADSNGDKYLTAYVNGERKSVKISDFMYDNIHQAETIEKTIRNVEEQLSFVFKPLQAFSSYVRNIHTSWSPSFIITNPLKDIQDAPFNSKDAVKFAKNYKNSYTDVNYAKNLNKIAKDFKKVTGQDITSIQDESRLKGKARDLYNNYESGMLWNKFVAGYGSVKLYGDTYGNMDQIISKETQKVSKDSKFKKMTSVIPNVNEFMELATRYAEFKTSIENGASLSEAFYNAKDVTTNFGRGGVITKALNRNGATFLNASVQGFSKFVRNFSGENGTRGVVGSIAKALTLGVLPAVFNHLFFGWDDEDEDYKALPDYIKDNYYLIKTDDGEFIRIPKGRSLSVFGSAARRTLEYAEGEKDAFEGYLDNAMSQSAPNNFLESNVFAPLIQASNNETWYGGDLIPARLQDKPVAEQYDESTDEFSKWLGKTLNISPYKINYVLDQYTGGIGDFIFPYITEEANSDGSFLAPLKDKFTANSTMDNKYAGEFYDKMNELEVIANGENATEEDQLRSQYMSAVSWEMSALYKEKREIQNDKSLSKAEKYEKVKAVQKEINALAKNALETYDTGNFGEYYSSIGDYQFNKYTDRNGEDAWGTLYEDEAEELKKLGFTDEEYNTYFSMKQEFKELNDDYYKQKDELEKKYGKDSDEYDVASDELYWQKKNTIIDKIMNSNFSDEEKAYVYNKYYSSEKIDVIATAGIDIDYLLDYDKNDFVAEYNAKGDAIPNSRKNKVIEYVNEYDLSIAEKAILIKSKNTFKFNDYNYEIVDYVDNLDIPYEEKVYILKSLDMEVDDEGNIYW